MAGLLAKLPQNRVPDAADWNRLAGGWSTRIDARIAEVLRKLLNGAKVGLDGRGRVVTTLELLQHRLAKMGHRLLLVTHTLLGQSPMPHAQRPPRQRLRSNAVEEGSDRRPISSTRRRGASRAWELTVRMSARRGIEGDRSKLMLLRPWRGAMGP